MAVRFNVDLIQSESTRHVTYHRTQRGNKKSIFTGEEYKEQKRTIKKRRKEKTRQDRDR